MESWMKIDILQCQKLLKVALLIKQMEPYRKEVESPLEVTLHVLGFLSPFLNQDHHNIFCGFVSDVEISAYMFDIGAEK